MKKLVAFLLLMGFVLGVFIACGSGGTSSTDTSKTNGTVRLSGSVAQ